MQTTVIFIKRYFYSLLGIVAFVLVQIGFARSYIFPVVSGSYSGRFILHVHGAVFMCWIFLGIFQPLLVERKKLDVHKKVGVYGFILAAMVALLGTYIGISSAQVHMTPKDAQNVKEFLLIPLSDMVLFVTFIALSINNLKRPETHKRLIILATLSILPAATGRMLSLFSWWTSNVVIDTILALLVMEITLILALVFDAFTKRRLHPVYLWGGLAVVIVHVSREYVKKSDVWMQISDWIVSHTHAFNY